jgi:subtilisin family serine protease
MQFQHAAWASLLALALGVSDAGAQRVGAGRFPNGPGGGGAGGYGHSPFGSGFGFGVGLPLFLPPPEPEGDDDPPLRRRPVHRPSADDAPRHIPIHKPSAEDAPSRRAVPLKAAPVPPPRLPAPQIARRPPPPPVPPSLLALPGRARLPGAEIRYREGEVLVETLDGASLGAIAATARRHRLVEVEATRIDLLGATVRLWRIPDARKAAAVIAELAREGALARIQPNYLYLAADDPAPAPAPALHQYALAKMKVAAAHAEGGGAPVRVAVIDTAVDETHPDLAGAVEARFDALGGKIVSRDHGTAMAGGIAANGRLRGVDPRVKLLSARAFDSDGASGALGSTLSILKGLDWAVASKARIVNMSFAGPDDPTLRDALAAAARRGVALVSAAGNLGPKAAPQYPGADAHVIAVTATDADDKRFAGANVGAYIAVSAPGVDVMLPASHGGYALETGTSVSSALVAGVIALMLEGKPDLNPDDVRARLAASAHPLGARDEFGAGLVDAEGAAPR